jgi:hypothetical protein
MKKLFFSNLAIVCLLFSTAFLVNSCGVENGAVAYDDIYLDDEQIAFEQEVEQRQEHRNVYQDKRFTHQPKQYKETLSNDTSSDSLDSTFDMDDYYDYAYTARINRFHNPAPIYDYYDDYFTDLYWYDRSFWSLGTSIYYGYRWWWPSYSFYWDYGFWSPYSSWYWGWNHGWYGWNWGWHDWAWYGGPHHHFHGWDKPHYYNSHDMNSAFYRPEREGGRLTRNNVGASSSARGNAISRDNSTFGDRYNERYGNNTLSRGNATTLSRNNNTVSRSNNAVSRNNNTISRSQDSQRQGTLTRNDNRLSKPANRMTSSSQNTINRGNVNSTNRNNSTVTRSSQNNNNNINRSSSTQKRTYTPPMQRQQRSSTTYRSTTTNRNSGLNRNTNNRSNNMNRSSNRSNSRVSSSPSRSSSRSSSMSSPSRSSSSGSRGGSMSRGGGRR